MTGLNVRIATFREWLKESYVGQTNYENWMGKLKAEILWLRENPPQKHVDGSITSNDYQWGYLQALDTLLRYLEEK